MPRKNSEKYPYYDRIKQYFTLTRDQKRVEQYREKAPAPKKSL